MIMQVSSFMQFAICMTNRMHITLWETLGKMILFSCSKDSMVSYLRKDLLVYISEEPSCLRNPELIL